jgi:radical SAM superfamily enzyme YgiQ (UPF0313 family)
MLTLINPNRMQPRVGPIGLDYVGGAARLAGIEVDLLDLALDSDPEVRLREYFRRRSPRLVGVTFRNIDDAFWPSATWFVPDLVAMLQLLGEVTDAPVVVGGVGFSIAAKQLVQRGWVDLGIRGDGEGALVQLYRAIEGRARFQDVPGLLWREAARVRVNRPAWPRELTVSPRRDLVDNRAYFVSGGQAGVETKRGCPRQCIYCADPVAKGASVRPRSPREVADEVECLLRQGIDVLHLCDGEFNVPRTHAEAVCEELITRGLGSKVRWYAYVAVRPFDEALAAAMRHAGCVGINFTGDSANDPMLAAYRHLHRRHHLATAVRACIKHGLTCMVDLLLGGPGETPESVRDTLDFMRRLGPDAVGVGLGMRVYPCTPAAKILAARGDLATGRGLRRRDDGPVDLLRPVFFIDPALGPHPAHLIRDLCRGDSRFFLPNEDVDDRNHTGHQPGDHNYNHHRPLLDAIERGARGAYWDILRSLGTIEEEQHEKP